MIATSSNTCIQLVLPLPPAKPYSLKYFVTHTGVSEAISTIENSVAKIINDEESFQIIYLYGLRGVGKSHLMHGYIQQIKGTSSLKNVLAIDLEPHLQDKAWVPSFIELYDRLKREGGLLSSELLTT
jgi:chromosomal replication initiation ATPase DnaA